MLKWRKSEESSENLTRPALKFTRKCEWVTGILHPCKSSIWSWVFLAHILNKGSFLRPYWKFEYDNQIRPSFLVKSSIFFFNFHKEKKKATMTKKQHQNVGLFLIKYATIFVLNFQRKGWSKQCTPWSNCSYWSSLIGVHKVFPFCQYLLATSNDSQKDLIKFMWNNVQYEYIGWLLVRYISV